ncbi:MAG: tyrosine-type recombinase/integrase [Firmicutes bacterium]|nr:tyrosine-type recombinase/integrase [Bacillota bacterium]
MKLSKAWALYEMDKKLLNYSVHTLKAYKLQLKLLARHLNDPDINSVTYDQLKTYLAQQEHLKPSSIGHRIRFIQSFFRWAIDEGHTSKNPASKLREPKLGTRVPKFLTEDDIETLRESCETPREHAIIEFLYTTGCRIGEAVGINKSDIDWQNKSVIVRGKGDREREVYFNTKCRIWLKKYLESRRDNDPALFVTERAPRKISISQMRGIIKKVADRAGIRTSVYPHRLRHSYATHLLNNGAPMEAIQQLLGHQKSETTQIYAQLSGERRRQLYQRYF